MIGERMVLDADFGRDAAASFGATSLVAGAILPFEGRSALLHPDGPPAAAFDAVADGWAAPNVPLLNRGAAAILPLGWLGDPDHRPRGVLPEELDAFAAQVQDAGMYWTGPWRVMDLDERRSDSIGSYLDALRAAGATHVDCWTYSETVGLALVHAGRAEEGSSSLALHVVPAAWVSTARAVKSVKDIDVRWSWSDVIALHGDGRSE